MPIVPVFKNLNVNNVANECGLIIEPDNVEVTEHEITFFVDCLINQMIDIVSKNLNSENSQTRMVNEMRLWKSFP